MLDQPLIASSSTAVRSRPSELERLRKRVSQQERTLEVLGRAVSVLHSGSEALREENRLLRLELHGRGAGSGPPTAR